MRIEAFARTNGGTIRVVAYAPSEMLVPGLAADALKIFIMDQVIAAVRETIENKNTAETKPPSAAGTACE
jgi:hypothetical protein